MIGRVLEGEKGLCKRWSSASFLNRKVFLLHRTYVANNGRMWGEENQAEEEVKSLQDLESLCLFPRDQQRVLHLDLR